MTSVRLYALIFCEIQQKRKIGTGTILHFPVSCNEYLECKMVPVPILRYSQRKSLTAAAKHTSPTAAITARSPETFMRLLPWIITFLRASPR